MHTLIVGIAMHQAQGMPGRITPLGRNSVILIDIVRGLSDAPEAQEA